MRHAWLPPLWVALTISPGWAQQAPLPSTAPGATAPALSLPAAIELALQHRPELDAARSEIEAADAALLQAGAHPNPVFEAELEDTRRDTRTTTFMLNQPIELGGQRAARQDAAGHALMAARHQNEAQRARLRAQVTMAFIDALAAQQRVHLAEAALALAARASDAATKRVVAGKVAPIDETKAKVAEAAVRVEALQAQAEWRAALLALQAATGGGRRVEQVDGTLQVPAVPAEEGLQARLADAPALRLAELEVQRLGALARLERARRVPDVTIGVGTRRSEELGRSQALLTLSIPLPVFGGNRGAELESLRRQDKARYEAQAARLRLQADVASAHSRLQAAVAEAKVLEGEILPGAQAAYDTSAKGFELGKFSFLDVLDSQRTLLQARTQHLKALAQAHRAAADIDQLLAGPANPADPIAAPRQP
jgi:cobalt-zinc-cadmium efflux system outer membrane protein